jgi:hypothetical protein
MLSQGIHNLNQGYLLRNQLPKSISKQKLIYTIGAGTIWSLLACYLGALAIWIMIFAFSGELFADKETGICYFPLSFLLTGVVILCWIIANLILMNYFIKIEGMENTSKRMI